MEIASNTFRAKIEEVMIPALRNFKPDIIFISAGFDGHADDFYYYLTEDDYEWITKQLIDVADMYASSLETIYFSLSLNRYCDGRLVSVLEGGYNLGSSKKGSGSNFYLAAKIHKRPIDEELGLYGSLARSCAAHVMALSRNPSA
jgi:acetoin utilization deacetylase AcuC-like enzyme